MFAGADSHDMIEIYDHNIININHKPHDNNILQNCIDIWILADDSFDSNSTTFGMWKNSTKRILYMDDNKTRKRQQQSTWAGFFFPSSINCLD